MGRVLVTGGAGYIGSHTAKALAAEGFEPLLLDSLATGHRRLARFGRLIEGDVADRGLLLRVMAEERIEAVAHFAACTSVGESMLDPGRYFRNNVAGTLALLEAMTETGVRRMVFSSSCAVYGDPLFLPMTENHPQDPVSPYGDSKAVIERLLHWFEKAHGLRYAALRYFNAAGADPEGEIGELHDPETHLIPIVIGAALGLRPRVEVFGTDYPTPDGTAIRDYVHVADLATAHVLALRHLEVGGASFAVNLGTGHGHSVREVIRAVEEVSGRTVPVTHGPRRAGDPPALVADASRAREVLGWKPACSDMAAIVQSAFAWHDREAKSRRV